MDNKAAIGKNIRFFRVMRNYTQKMLAESILSSPSTIAMYETGKREPDMDTLEAIADALNIRMVDLIPGQAEVYTVSAEDLRAAGVLSDEERMLVAAYREARPTYQALAMELLMEHKKEVTP